MAKLPKRKDGTCGAKTRTGKLCKSKAMPNGRCRMHGGNNKGPPLGSQNNLKHGIYAKSLSKSEAELYDQIDTKDLTHEIKMAKIRLRRALMNLRLYNAGKYKPKVTKAVHEVKNGNLGVEVSSKKERSVPDFEEIASKYMARVASLIKTQHEMNLDGQDDPDDIANKIKTALKEIEDSIG